PPTTSDESTPPRPDTPIHRNTLLMPLSDYIYCKIFVAKASEQEVREIASSALGAYFQGKFLEVSDILVEVSRNPDSHGDRNFDVTVQVSRRRLRRFRASSTGPGPDRPERRTYRCRAWPRSLHRNAPRKTTRLRPETVSTPTPSGGP